MTRPRPLSVISLFSGAGGIDYGLHAAGFETRVCVDLDSDACATLSHNGQWMVLNKPIDDVPSSKLLFHAGVDAGDVSLVAGGPPCQPFSKSGYWASGDAERLNDPRADTLRSYLRVVEDVLPRAILFENVRGFAYRGKSEGLDYLLEGLAAINVRQGVNYQPHFAVLQAADYGVPQLRERFFLVASREGSEFRFPQPASQKDLRVAWDAIGDVEVDSSADLDVRGRWSALLPTIPEGRNYQWHTDRGDGLPLFGWRRHFWNFLLKLAKDRPSWTIQAQPGPAVGPFHWENRRLSVRELARLQTFPDTVNVLGGLSSAHRQIGNAVPSLLAEIIGRHIRTQLLDSPTGLHPKLLRPALRPLPPPDPVAELPGQYASLIGEHSAHPGTGRGHGALRRRSRVVG